MTASARQHAPRKRDADATRAAILNAAKRQFAAYGFEGASLRAIMFEAGADPALVKRYFGDKEALFLEALKESFRPRAFEEWNKATFAREFAESMAGHAHQDPERMHTFQFHLRAATSPATAPLLDQAMRERFMEPLREWLDEEEASARASVLAAACIGLLVVRLIRDKPLRGRERADFIARTTKMLEGLLPERA